MSKLTSAVCDIVSPLLQKVLELWGEQDAETH